MQKNEFVEYIIGDQLAQLSGLSARAMFGGFGVYLEGTIVGIVVADELYLKVDESNRSVYEAMGSVPFSYKKKDGTVTATSYWKVPEEVTEDRELLTTLALESYEINLQRAVEKKPNKKRTK